MTYIVGGKLDNQPFLMVDCKIENRKENEDVKYLFADKVVSFNSHIDEAFFCQMGHQLLKHFITMVDYMLTVEKRKIDVFDLKTMRDIFDEINNAFSYSHLNFMSDDSSLFFISKNDICKYEISFDNEQKKYAVRWQVKIKNNKCLTSNSPEERNVNCVEGDLKEFCKWIIVQERRREIDDLKDRFTFISSDGNKLNYEYPYLSKNDIINQFASMGFDKLE